MHIFKDTKYDFLRWRIHAIVVSWIVIIAGIAVMVTKGIPRGVEFAGGTVVIEKFDQAVTVQQVRVALDHFYPGGGQDSVVQAYGDPSQKQIMIRVPQIGGEAGTALTGSADQVENALRQANLGTFTRLGTE